MAFFSRGSAKEAEKTRAEMQAILNTASDLLRLEGAEESVFKSHRLLLKNVNDDASELIAAWKAKAEGVGENNIKVLINGADTYSKQVARSAIDIHAKLLHFEAQAKIAVQFQAELENYENAYKEVVARIKATQAEILAAAKSVATVKGRAPTGMTTRKYMERVAAARRAQLDAAVAKAKLYDAFKKSLQAAELIRKDILEESKEDSVFNKEMTDFTAKIQMIKNIADKLARIGQSIADKSGQMVESAAKLETNSDGLRGSHEALRKKVKEDATRHADLIGKAIEAASKRQQEIEAEYEQIKLALRE